MCDVRNSDPVDHSQLPSDRRYSVEYNLIFYCIEIVCEPLLIVPPFRNYAIMRGTTALGYLFAYIVYRRMRTQLARVIAGTKADDTYPRSISRANLNWAASAKLQPRSNRHAIRSLSQAAGENGVDVRGACGP